MFDEPIQFEEAEKAIAERMPTATALSYRQIMRQWAPDARQRAFFSARVLDATVLSELHRRVQQVVSGEMTSDQATRLMQDFFRNGGRESLVRMGFLPPERGQGAGVEELASTPRLRLIFETNVRMAQETGHYRQWMEVAEAFPYGIWHCGHAEEHRPEHLARDGRCYHHSHDIWTKSPPGGEFNCHCWREVISADEARARGLVPEAPDSPLVPSSLGFDPSRGMDQPVQPGRRVLPELAEKAKEPPTPEQLAEILPEAASQPAVEEPPEQHTARRRAQWQAAYEKRRDAWEQSIVEAAPVPKDAPDRERKLQPYQQLAATLKEQYTPEAAKLGKPPKVVFDYPLDRKPVEVNADGTQILVAGNLPTGRRLQAALQGISQQMQETLAVQLRLRQNTDDTIKLLSARKISKHHSWANDIHDTNPNWNSNIADHKKNCQRCISAFEARSRGIDVTAAPRPNVPSGSDLLECSTGQRLGWASVYIHAEGDVVNCCAGSGRGSLAKIERAMANMPDGARCGVQVAWRGRNAGGHVFIAIKKRGKVIFCDPQAYEMHRQRMDYSVPGNPRLITTETQLNCREYFTRANGKACYIMRIDDKEFTPNIAQCVEK